ncbi:hypothetical protein V8F20_005348 [Naviculisporaceae sp. PSN 640]
MQFTKNLIALAGFFALATAAPAAEPEAAPAPLDESAALVPRGTVTVTAYSGDVCNGAADRVTLTNGGYRCWVVSGKRSIGMTGDCTVITWSGNDCRGSSYRAGQGCSSVLYGSVSIQC